MKKLSLFLLGFGFALSLVSCKTSSSLVSEKLVEGTLIDGEWETYALEINGLSQEICESNIKIEKSQNDLYSISGDSGVNRYFGSAKISEKSFLVQDNMASTKMAGDPKSMAFEDNFTKVLMEVASFKIYKENDLEFLSLENKNGTEKIIFKRTK